MLSCRLARLQRTGRTSGKVATLTHKAWDDSMEHGSSVVQWLARLPCARSAMSGGVQAVARPACSIPTPRSPVHSARKFSAVMGTTSPNSSMTSRPTSSDPMAMSMKQRGRHVRAAAPSASSPCAASLAGVSSPPTAAAVSSVTSPCSPAGLPLPSPAHPGAPCQAQRACMHQSTSAAAWCVRGTASSLCASLIACCLPCGIACRQCRMWHG